MNTQAFEQGRQAGGTFARRLRAAGCEDLTNANTDDFWQDDAIMSAVDAGFYEPGVDGDAYVSGFIAAAIEAVQS